MLYAAQDLFEEADVNRDDLVHRTVPEGTVSVAVLNGQFRAEILSLLARNLQKSANITSVQLSLIFS